MTRSEMAIGASSLFLGATVGAGVAVSGGLGRLLPGWMMASGLVLATLAELSWLTLVLPPAAYLLPVVRFPAFAWLITAGAFLPRSRRVSPSRTSDMVAKHLHLG